MIAEKLCTPYIPKFEIVKVPPASSVGKSLFSFALPANYLTFYAISSKPFKFVAVTTGANKP